VFEWIAKTYQIFGSFLNTDCCTDVPDIQCNCLKKNYLMKIALDEKQKTNLFEERERERERETKNRK
jgi:hypothetical protein